MRHTSVLILAALAAGSLACSKAKDEATAAVATAIANQALADKGQHIDTTKMMAAMQEVQKAQTAPKRAIVNFHQLTPFVPDAPAGWTATPIEGSTTAVAGFQSSEVSRRYTKGPSNMKVTIVDMSQNPGVAMVALAFSVTEDSTAGYRKPYGVGGVTGTEHWTIAGKRSEIEAMTKNQILIQVEGGPLDGPEVARDLMGKIDSVKIASL